MLAPNTILHNRYRILRQLGAGGMGEVYLALDAKLERHVALKLLPDKFILDKERLHRFVREAKAASALNHPNIITIHEIGEENGAHFIATEYIEGETLRRKLQTERLEIDETLSIAMQIAAALDAAHRNGIVHRDIKPENVMLREDELVKVLDFGLAKLTEKKDDATSDTEAPTQVLVKTTLGVVMGTTAYMSPEQARGREVDARTDIFSLGAVMYEMLTGRLPFAGETTADILGALLHKEPQPLRELAPETPADLQHIVSKALRKDKDERYQTIKSLLADLRTLKQEIEFAAKLERSASPERDRVASASQSPVATTANVALSSTGMQAATVRPTSSAEYITSGIKQRKGSFSAALAILVVAALSFGYWYFSRSSPTTTQIESIAVLPFKNESVNSDTEYLSDGISEALINSLTELRQLRVIARSTAFRYKGREVDPQRVGRDLNVRAVLTGRVRQIGDRLDIQVDLVDATTGAQLWGEGYERKVSDVLAVKQAIAREVTEKLRLRLSGEEQQLLVRRDTTNAEAYQFYLRGRFHWNKRRVKDLQQAIEYFQQAVAVDPNYALGYAGLADAYTLFSGFSDIPSRELMPKAKEAALRALSLDDGLAEAHAALGLILLLYDYDFAGAERESKRAIELNPNYATAHHFYSRLLSAQGRHEEAFAEIRRALEIDPLALPINWFYGHALFHARKYDESIAQLKKTLELDANFPGTHNHLARVYQAKGNYTESVEEYAKYQELIGEQRNAALVRESFAKGGWQGFVRAMVERPDLSPYLKAHFYAALGEKDKAFAELNKAYENRDGFVVMYLKVDPRLDPLRSDPRFQDLLRRVGFPQ
ncbi:MAG: protein kinase [Pyrinomonadaceae bacterium]|nr:protein kinase [Pyrinomonadaceae bacterium]